MQYVYAASSATSSMLLRVKEPPFQNIMQMLCCKLEGKKMEFIASRRSPILEKLEPPRNSRLVDSASPFQLGVSWVPSTFARVVLAATIIAHLWGCQQK